METRPLHRARYRNNNYSMRPDVWELGQTCDRPTSARQPRQSYKRFSTPVQWPSWRPLRIPLVPCSQFVWTRSISFATVSPSLSHYSNAIMGYCYRLFTYSFRNALPWRPARRCNYRIGNLSIGLLYNPINLSPIPPPAVS